MMTLSSEWLVLAAIMYILYLYLMMTLSSEWLVLAAIMYKLYLYL